MDVFNYSTTIKSLNAEIDKVALTMAGLDAEIENLRSIVGYSNLVNPAINAKIKYRSFCNERMSQLQDVKDELDDITKLAPDQKSILARMGEIVGPSWQNLMPFNIKKLTAFGKLIFADKDMPITHTVMLVRLAADQCQVDPRMLLCSAGDQL